MLKAVSRFFLLNFFLIFNHSYAGQLRLIDEKTGIFAQPDRVVTDFETVTDSEHVFLAIYSGPSNAHTCLVPIKLLRNLNIDPLTFGLNLVEKNILVSCWNNIGVASHIEFKLAEPKRQ